MERRVDQSEADAVLTTFRSLDFDPGLVVLDVRMTQCAEGPILLVWFEDQRFS
jgi:hypothetical protein